MPAKLKHEDKSQRLAKSISKDQKNARHECGRENSIGAKPRGNTRRKMANPRNVSPLTRLVQSLAEEGIRFQMVGMSAAILQGVPATTTDTGFWVDLPERQYVRLMNLVVKQGGTAMARTMYGLSDGSVVNFIFSMTGLKNFKDEFARSRELIWNGLKVRVLPLERIYKSKHDSAREKDIAHLPLIQKVIRGEKIIGRGKKR